MPPNLQSRPCAFPTFLRAAFWIKLHVAIAPMLLVAFSFCNAAQSVKLAWDASPSSDVTGYNVYYRTASGDWSLPLDVGKVTTATVSNLNDATTYVLSVTAYNSARIESARSNEVSYTTPPPPEERYTLTVVRGSGSGPYRIGDLVTVNAQPARGEEFSHWEGDTSILLMPLNYSSNQARIIGEDVTITAVYSALPTYTVTVTNGAGDGDYFAGDTVQIVADAAPAGQQFAGWTVTGNVTLANALSQTTTFRMPDSAAAVTAKYVYKLSSIWSSSTVPAVIDGGPDRAVQLGVKFRSDVAGTIRGIRFYKAAGNTGTHVGSLWSRAGTRLANATFTNETASGWQEVSFAKPVAIRANTVYVASYHTTAGHYSINTNYFASTGADNAPLHALANGVSGGNGVYRYGNSSGFPNQTWNASNYWVDVVFQPN